MDQIFLDPEPKLVDVGAGSINCTCLELEPWPEILVPVPQPWFPLPLICELNLVVAATGNEERIRISSVQEQALIPFCTRKFI